MTVGQRIVYHNNAEILWGGSAFVKLTCNVRFQFRELSYKQTLFLIISYWTQIFRCDIFPLRYVRIFVWASELALAKEAPGTASAVFVSLNFQNLIASETGYWIYVGG